MNTDTGIGAILRRDVSARRGLMVAGASNALSARLIEQLGFEAVYLTGAGITNTFYGLPDLGFIGLADLAQHTAATRDAVQIPIIVDADTGFGNELNVRHTVRTLERAGANAIQLEDQQMPKKCGHFSGKAVIPLAEAVSKVKAAVDARQSADFLIIARTDARAIEGLEPALARGEMQHKSVAFVNRCSRSFCACSLVRCMLAHRYVPSWALSNRCGGFCGRPCSARRCPR